MAKRCRMCDAPLEGGLFYKIASKILYLKESEKKKGYCNHCENKV